MRKRSPGALAVAAQRNRGKATWALALAVVAATSLWLSAGGSATGSSNRIVVTGTATKSLPKNEPKSPPGNPITFSQKATLSCAAQQNGQIATCTAIATLLGASGPLTNIPLATFAQVFTSASPISLVFGLSQHTLDLLYRHRGDPRCTVQVAIVNDSSPAGSTGTGPQGSTAKAGIGPQSTTAARSFSAVINVPLL
jgi:hypothetical protein